ncbi:MAG TPA: hypothetical protein VKZ41_07715, partial [Gemmatimonadales bacterium]|nr:hypothetical protein [Gemmatimonadales bacterium]
MTEFLILRPSRRVFRAQLATGVLLTSTVIAALWVTERGPVSPLALGAAAAAGAFALVLQASWLRPSRRWYGVLTPGGLLLREAGGTRRRIEWEE